MGEEELVELEEESPGIEEAEEELEAGAVEAPEEAGRDEAVESAEDAAALEMDSSWQADKTIAAAMARIARWAFFIS
jgi:hypothetical protein